MPPIALTPVTTQEDAERLALREISPAPIAGLCGLNSTIGMCPPYHEPVVSLVIRTGNGETRHQVVFTRERLDRVCTLLVGAMSDDQRRKFLRAMR